MFRVFFLFHRKLLSQLSRCAWKTICQYLEVSLSEEHQPAGILSIATAGDFLNWNPHIHALISSGAFCPDGSFVTVPLFQENVLRELFEANVFKLLVSEGLITAELITKMRTWRHSGFHVYAGPTITHKEDAVRVGLYIVRAPASASRLQLAEDGLLKYLAKGSVPDDRCDPLFEPNGQILVQLPDHTTQAHVPKDDSENEWLKERRSTWAALIKLIYESDPLLCPKCHTQMTVISVIKDGAVIDKSWIIYNTNSMSCRFRHARHHLRLQLAVRTSPWIRLSGPKEIKSQPIQPPGSIPRSVFVFYPQMHCCWLSCPPAASFLTISLREV